MLTLAIYITRCGTGLIDPAHLKSTSRKTNAGADCGRFMDVEFMP